MLIDDAREDEEKESAVLIILFTACYNSILPERKKEGASFKTFQFGQAQGGLKFQPQEYIEYFED